MKLFFGVVIGLLLGVLGYCALALFSTSETISHKYARVTIKNESRKNVNRVLLQHERGSFEVSGLKVGEEVRFVFRSEGENSYKMMVMFEDSTMLTSNGAYFELGYRGTETISDSAITTTHN